MKANLTEISGAASSLHRTKLADKITRQQAAIQILSAKGNGNKRDTLSISNTARSFLRESIADNTNAVLDAINFGENVSCGYESDFKEYGVISFDYNGSRQMIPDYAVPKINVSSLPPISAVNNSLILNNKSYYSWTTLNGGRYAWTVPNGKIGWAPSESLLAENTNQTGTNYKWEMRTASNILSSLAQGKTLYGFNREDVLSVCESVGFTTGFFSMDAGNGLHNYILKESGEVINVDKKIEQLNRMNWIEAGFKEGDTISVYGNDYIIDSNGRIDVSVEDKFTSTEIIYPSH